VLDQIDGDMKIKGEWMGAAVDRIDKTVGGAA
jgi:hypothetical protein